MSSLPQNQQYESLDSVLRTDLKPGTLEFLEVASRRIAWWNSCRVKTWFLENGFKLYRWDELSWGPPFHMFPLSVEQRESPFPFAYFTDDPGSDSQSFIAESGYERTVAFAQDDQGRHFALKTMLTGSEELRILKHLQQQRRSTSIDEFQNVIPILDIIACEDHWLAVMPRWGDCPLEPACGSIREVFHFIHCLLKGLTFLHEHRIVHGDIKSGNILVNHIRSDDYDSGIANNRQSRRCQGQLTYALFDFDCARMYPPSITLEECRLPSYASFSTHVWQTTADTLQGEVDYNPFAFDVGMLGVLFCSEFQHLTPIAPMLAPLLDKMITRDVPQRFTASEALQFFDEEVYPLTTEQELNQKIPEDASSDQPYDFYDRWKGLGPVFVEKWAAFREPPVTTRLRILRYICEYRYIYYTISYLRRFSRYIRRLTIG